MEELVRALENQELCTGLLKAYIVQGLQENPDILMQELYCQIRANYESCVDIFGQQIVSIVLEHFERKHGNYRSIS